MTDFTAADPTAAPVAGDVDMDGGAQPANGTALADGADPSTAAAGELLIMACCLQDGAPAHTTASA
jgi:hypothetical protein